MAPRHDVGWCGNRHDQAEGHARSPTCSACRRVSPGQHSAPFEEFTAAWILRMGEWRRPRLHLCYTACPLDGSLRGDGRRARRRSGLRARGTDAMLRATAVGGRGGWGARARRLAAALSPVAVSPAAPRETMAVLEAFGPSLMPRSARARGVAMGLGILGTRATSGVAEKLTRMAARPDAPLPRQLLAWAVIGGAGAALAALPERHSRKIWVASVQSAGLLLRDGAAGGAVHDLGRWLQRRYPEQRGVRPLTSGAVHCAGLLYRAGRRLPVRERAGERRPRPEAAEVAETLATSYVVTTAGMGLAKGFGRSRRALESYFGSAPSKKALARLVNAGLWAGGAAA